MEESDKKLIFKGILKSIDMITLVPLSSGNGIIGPGYSSTITGYRPETTVSIEESFGDIKKKFVYEGVVLPDSLGHTIEVYHKMIDTTRGPTLISDDSELTKREDTKNMFLDTAINRWYA